MNLDTLEPGEVIKHNKIWYGRLPTEEKLFCNLSAHDIVEHNENTITVSPSILVTTWDGKRWHGYLRNGVWERLSDSNV